LDKALGSGGTTVTVAPGRVRMIRQLVPPHNHPTVQPIAPNVRQLPTFEVGRPALHEGLPCPRPSSEVALTISCAYASSSNAAGRLDSNDRVEEPLRHRDGLRGRRGEAIGPLGRDLGEIRRRHDAIRDAVALGVGGGQVVAEDIISFARCGPTMRGGVHPPASGMMPRRTKTSMRRAAVRHEDQVGTPSTRLAPPPAAVPFTEAMTASRSRGSTR